MKEQNIKELIEKEEQKNIYLSGVLNSLEAKISKKPIFPQNQRQEMRGDIQMAQIKNINKRIQIYQQELQKIRKVNTKGLMNQLKQMREEITNKQDLLNKLTKQLESLQQETGHLRTKSYGKDKNKSIQTLFGHKNYQMEALKIKLQHLEDMQGVKVYDSPRKSGRSYSQAIKQPEVLKSQGVDKKSKAYRYALFRNLIRFYTQQQQKLNKQIVSLEQKRSSRQKQDQSITMQIKSYQIKICSLKQQNGPNIK